MISICHENVRRLAETISTLSLAPDFAGQITPPSRAGRETAFLSYLWAAAICHGTKGQLKGEFAEKQYQGWDYLLRAFCRRGEEGGGSLSALAISQLSEGALEDILRGDAKGVDMRLNDLSRRAEILRLTAADLIEKYDGSAAGLLGRSGGLVGGPEGAYARLGSLRGFQDPLQKKSTAFLMTVHFSGLWTILDDENIVPMIDYHRMRLLLRTGCVNVSTPVVLQTLREQGRIDEEVGAAIRTASMEVCKELVSLSGMAMFDFDVLLWAHARSCCRNRPICISGQVENDSFYEYLSASSTGQCVFQEWCPGALEADVRALWEPMIPTEDY